MSGGDGSASGVLIGRARRVWVAHNYRTESLYGFTGYGIFIADTSTPSTRISVL